MKVPEQYRVHNHPIPQFSSDASSGANGYFFIPHYKVADYFFGCMVSDGTLIPEDMRHVPRWEHVSVTIKTDKRSVQRCPTWEEMCFVKSLFWDDEEPVMQLHPPKSQWVNNHPHCLHLWKSLEVPIPLPPMIMVGIKPLNTDENTTK